MKASLKVNCAKSKQIDILQISYFTRFHCFSLKIISLTSFIPYHVSLALYKDKSQSNLGTGRVAGMMTCPTTQTNALKYNTNQWLSITNLPYPTGFLDPSPPPNTSFLGPSLLTTSSRSSLPFFFNKHGRYQRTDRPDRTKTELDRYQQAACAISATRSKITASAP